MLLLTKRLLGRQASFRRLLMGAAIGGLWACTAVLLSLSFWWLEALLSFLAAMLMTMAAFRLKKIREILSAAGCFYLCASAAGGLVNVFYYRTPAGRAMQSAVMPAYQLAVFLTAAFLILYTGLRLFGRYRRNEQMIYDVELWHHGKNVCLKGLMDTGNRLYTPVSHEPVHILSYDACHSLLSSLNLEEQNLRMIPFRSLGKDNGMIMGLVIEKMTLRQNGYEHTVTSPVIGLSKGSLCTNGQYQMILHPDIRSLL